MATADVAPASFESTVSSNDVVCVDSWASWCGQCRMIAPGYKKASVANPDIVFGKVDTEAQQSLAAAAETTSIRALMEFKGETPVFSQPGGVRDLDVARIEHTRSAS